jgi:gliding motility-associated transport system permease protein
LNAVTNVWALVRKEWRHYFGSPIGYILLAAWTALFGSFFYSALVFFLRRSMMAGQMEMGGAPKMSLNEWVISPVLHNMAVVALFIVPVLTMRLFAEEKRQGTMELLGTAPVTNLQIVLGKFLAAAGVYATMILAGLLNMAFLWYHAATRPEWKPVLTASVGLFLFGCCFIALGTFVSTLTRNQIIAAVVSFCMFLLLWILDWAADPAATGFWKVVSELAVTRHLEDLVKGVVALKDVVFYLSFIAFGLFLAHQSVESQRWRA